MVPQPRFLLLRQALLRPILLFGGDRTLTLWLWGIVTITCLIARLNLRIIIPALVLGFSGQFVLQRWAKSDPLWWPKYRRSLQYKPFYQAHGGVRTKAKRVTPTL